MSRTTDPDARLFAALADPIRLSILRQLTASAEVCACEFDACGTVSQPTVSHHLRILRDAGIVSAERRGTWVWYRLEPAALERLRAILDQLVPGEPRPATEIGGTRRAGRSLPVLETSVST